MIVPSLDEGRVIVPLLESLQPCRVEGHELILADGGSGDRTVELAAPLVDRVVHAPRGRALQMNAGARHARGGILWFLHADSTVSPGMVEAIQRALAEKDRRWGFFDVRLSGSRPSLRLVEFMMNRRSRLFAIATGDQGLFVTRDAFEAAGGYPGIPLMEDIALSKRLKRLSRPTRPPGRVGTSSRRWEREGVARTVLLMWRLRAAYALGADPARLARRYRPCSSPEAES